MLRISSLCLGSERQFKLKKVKGGQSHVELPSCSVTESPTEQQPAGWQTDCACGRAAALWLTSAASLPHFERNVHLSDNPVDTLESLSFTAGEPGLTTRHERCSEIQSELEELQLKLDEMENRSQRSNLSFIGVPEETEAASSMNRVVSDLIYKCYTPRVGMTNWPVTELLQPLIKLPTITHGQKLQVLTKE
ncbi:hypothetical protein NDU88_007829 [Pleurodeles waltl]|uniref:Uncharacterized protein n=1 Tax=Pleurodeles waltl TaxID=8319 RepID=A0AAV7QR29_PLEWA|nr:hypothetical protein NDU88_007829 [Pleurodeles waltl]